MEGVLTVPSEPVRGGMRCPWAATGGALPVICAGFPTMSSPPSAVNKFSVGTHFQAI